MLRVLLTTKVLEGIGPEEVAHGAECGGLLEPVQLKKKNRFIDFLLYLIRIDYTYKSMEK